MRFLFILLIFFPEILYPQVNSHARTSAMGNTGGSLANIAAYEASSVTLGYTTDMNVSRSAGFNAVAIIYSKGGNFGLSAQRYTFSNDFTAADIRLVYSRNIGKRFLTGLGLSYHQLLFTENYRTSSVMFEVATRYYLNPEWLVGIQVNAARFITDMSYVFDKLVLLTMESEYDWQYGFDFRTGIEYAIAHWIWLRGGVSVNHFKQFAGIGLSHQNLGLDLSSQYHPKLGYSSHISVNYAF